jgi:hypothetical protein
VTCTCNKPPLAMFARSDIYPDINLCCQCKHMDPGHNCHRFSSMVTGSINVISCEEARAEESLCGFTAKYWEKQKEA